MSEVAICEGATEEEGVPFDRGRKKVKAISEDGETAGDVGIRGSESLNKLSYKATLLDAKPRPCSFDVRGSGVFEEAWKGYIESLQEFFGGGNNSQDKARTDYGKSLTRIVGLIGRTLKVDSITHLTERGQFVHICVELDLFKRLTPAIQIF